MLTDVRLFVSVVVDDGDVLGVLQKGRRRANAVFSLAVDHAESLEDERPTRAPGGQLLQGTNRKQVPATRGGGSLPRVTHVATP